MGGYVAGNGVIIDALRSTASGFIFTTSLPPSLAAGALASVRHLKTHREERVAMHDASHTLKEELVARGYPLLLPSQSHIVPLLVGDAEKCTAASRMLLKEHGIYVQVRSAGPSATSPRCNDRLQTLTCCAPSVAVIFSPPFCNHHRSTSRSTSLRCRVARNGFGSRLRPRMTTPCSRTCWAHWMPLGTSSGSAECRRTTVCRRRRACPLRRR